MTSTTTRVEPTGPIFCDEPTDDQWGDRIARTYADGTVEWLPMPNTTAPAEAPLTPWDRSTAALISRLQLEVQLLTAQLAVAMAVAFEQAQEN